MSRETESKFETASGAERAVFEAMHLLPDGYKVTRPSEGLTVHGKDMVYSYEPDFVVSDPEGRKLMVEVGRPGALSWSNLARFVQIDRSARDAETAFLVIVPGEEREAMPPNIPEFSEVNIAYASDEPGMTRAVVRALHDPPAITQGVNYVNDLDAAS